MSPNHNPNTVEQSLPQHNEAALDPQPVPAPTPPSGRGAVRWVLQALPTVLVLAGLAALGIWGHHTGWSLPSFAALTGEDTQDKDEWCDEHGVPEAVCVECNPDLLPRGTEYGWCKVHGIPECPLEHPDVAQLPNRPQPTAADLERARRALNLAPRPENNSKCQAHKRRIQFVSQEAIEKAGIDVAPVWQAPMVEALSANGKVTYDQTRVARLSARVPGTVWWVPKQVGDSVRRGEVLALVDAAEVGKAKAEFLQAAVQLEVKEKTLKGFRAASRDLPERTLEQAEAAAREAQIRLATAEQALVNLGLPIRADDIKGLLPEELRQRVQFLGIPEALARQFDSRTTTTNLLPVVSSLEGVVVAREVVAGEVVDAAKVLFVVADVRQLWLTLNLRLEDTKTLAVGQAVRFRSDGLAEEVTGTVGWISTAVDEKTRTVKVRADLANPQGRLRANTFGQGQIILREEKNAVVVPNEAIHWEGDCHIVFVRDKNFLHEGAPKVFHVRTVRIGVRDGQNTEIIAGVLPGEVVATRGSGLLLAELLKNNLGAG